MCFHLLDEKTMVLCGRCSPTWKRFLRKNSSMRHLKIVPKRPLSNTLELMCLGLLPKKAPSVKECDTGLFLRQLRFMSCLLELRPEVLSTFLRNLGLCGQCPLSFFPKAQLAHLGVTADFAGTMPYAELLGPEQKKEWVAHRALVALFVASHRGHVETAKFLLRHGADLHSKTPLGRTALHVAAVAGQCDCIELLLSYGAKALGPDSEGQTAVSLARLWGQKQSERTIVRFQWRKRSLGAVPPSGAVNRALQHMSGPTS
ncbi:ankyrin repeat domain-containing protein 60 isoform X4 [Aquila chrysaetos chrysaetos]|uniref:ankyrin repeat domain-containing protein 60 isoform X4 n=1 Tax=Aquila chrysaetos chrysaetos TaxID=223781 RepID=UPI0011768128|nr:ankyrin repeat domain-containing protein 60 isoform X4 [Aquila chrysaetos chrysaetos]